uniref:G-protein coupled receptors family 1 profile domain-containing protein n=1 Tax=Cavia porcellus TaxID=10141 RepID=A0A286XWJ0_CAVPO
MENNRNVTEFILIGLTLNPRNQKVIFALSSPIYFFQSHLSLIDTIYSSLVAKLIMDSLHEKKVISFNGCMVQVYAEHVFGATEVVQLRVMAYDGYVAICKLLHYRTIMSTSCDTHTLVLFVAANSGFICLLNFLLLMVFYVIIRCALKNYSLDGRIKVFSTCVSHIPVAVMSPVPCIFMCLCPVAILPIDKAVVVFYTMVAPINTEVKSAVWKL